MMCDLPGLFVYTEEGWCRLQWSSSSLYLSSPSGARPVRPVSLGRRDAKMLSARKVVAALKAFCSGKSSSVHLGAPLPLQDSQCSVVEVAPLPRLVSCGVQTERWNDSDSSASEPSLRPEPCLELVIDEEDVRLFRQWLSRFRTNCWRVDVRKFDLDEKYKEEIFYKINPLIRLKRCPMISDMIQKKQLRTVLTDSSVNDEMTVQQFAKKLGLKSASEQGGHKVTVLSSLSDGSVSDDSLFDSSAARLRLRSARHTRGTKPVRSNGDIENRHPADMKLTLNKLTGHRRALVRANNNKPTVKPYSSPLKNKSPVQNNKNRKRSLSSSSESSSERPSRLKPNQSPNKNRSTRSKSRSRPNRSPIKTTNNNGRSRSLSTTTSVERPKQTHLKPNKAETRDKPRSRSKTRSRSPIRLRRSGNTSLERLKQTNNRQVSTRPNTSPSKTNKQVNEPRESRSRSRSLIRLRKSLSNKSNEPSSKSKSPVKTGSGSQRSVKSGSSGDAAKKTQSKEQPAHSNKASTIGGLWQLPRYLNRKSCVRAGREYSALEDQALVGWLSADEGRARRVNGNQLWRALERDWPGIAGIKRSWHSLRNRYLRYVLPALGGGPRGLALPAAQAGRLRAAAATGVNKGRSAPPRSPPPRGAYCGVARRRLKAAVEADTAPKPSRSNLRSSNAPQPDVPTSDPAKVSPAKSPTYAALTRRFALRPSDSPQEKGSPTRHTRRLYNPRPL